eukprot:TRINITY_DN8858_c0_g1_i1.p1 TRINITY_DN8858_c0_g1~~TRINITY_DN8858_c0_g1_i1.p1  ORF type:complete len:488 (+),score=100.95 TRINITY_DN8858_c0_g1_i1:104-1465(+)
MPSPGGRHGVPGRATYSRATGRRSPERQSVSASDPNAIGAERGDGGGVFTVHRRPLPLGRTPRPVSCRQRAAVPGGGRQPPRPPCFQWSNDEDAAAAAAASAAARSSGRRGLRGGEQQLIYDSDAVMPVTEPRERRVRRQSPPPRPRRGDGAVWSAHGPQTSIGGAGTGVRRGAASPQRSACSPGPRATRPGKGLRCSGGHAAEREHLCMAEGALTHSREEGPGGVGVRRFAPEAGGAPPSPAPSAHGAAGAPRGWCPREPRTAPACPPPQPHTLSRGALLPQPTASPQRRPVSGYDGTEWSAERAVLRRGANRRAEEAEGLSLLLYSEATADSTPCGRGLDGAGRRRQAVWLPADVTPPRFSPRRRDPNQGGGLEVLNGMLSPRKRPDCSGVRSSPGRRRWDPCGGFDSGPSPTNRTRPGHSPFQPGRRYAAAPAPGVNPITGLASAAGQLG